MKTIAFINLKGGVGKSCTTDILAYNMSKRGKRVLVIDLDKQGNTSKYFECHSPDGASVAKVLLRELQIGECVRATKYTGIDIVPSNMHLLTANRLIMSDPTRKQHDRLCKALAVIGGKYDYCLLDCPPDIDMATINALVAANYVIVPIDCAEWALDGLHEMMRHIEGIQEDFNPRLELLGCLVTKYYRSNYANEIASSMVRNGWPVFCSVIRQTVKVPEAISAHSTLDVIAPGGTATQDYESLCDEILSKVEGNGYGRI